MPVVLTPDDAIGRIPPGSHIVLAQATGEPQTLAEALARQHARLAGCTLVVGLSLWEPPYAQPEASASFRIKAFIVGPGLRRAVNERRAEYLPCHFSEVPRLLTSGLVPPEVVLLQASTPDARGLCTVGPALDYMPAALERARLVIAEINDQVPHVRGDRVPYARFDCVVETSRPPIEVPLVAPSPEAEAIGRHVAGLIPEGACLQVGIGALPQAVMANLRDHRGLGLHTGVIPDGVRDLISAGVMDGSRKEVDRGRLVGDALLGTKALYAYADRHPLLELRRAEYTHSLAVISQLHRFVALNSALQVDLTGQVTAESLGPRQVSGTGGQLDYLRAAAASPGGVGIVALYATARGGAGSNIVPALPEGSAVTTGRADVAYVVTEFGVADLRGKTLRERAEALIRLAHPKFRAALEAARRW